MSLWCGRLHHETLQPAGFASQDCGGLKRVEAPSNVRNFRHLNIDLARGVITGAEAVNSTSQNS